MKFKFTFFYLLFVLFYFQLSGQDKTKDTEQNPGFISIFSYGYDLSAGNMNEDFGNNFRFGVLPTFYFYNSNFSIGLKFDYIFGYNVKKNTIGNLLTYDNQIINTESSLSSLNISERGFYSGIVFSKIFAFDKNNKRTGLRCDFSLGYMSHWIRYNDELGKITQLSGDYLKGYDRKSGGFTISEFIGYQMLHQKSKINFVAGIDFIQGFTKNLRLYDYYDNSVENLKRKDLLFGFRLGWILPLYIEKNPEEIFY